MPITATDIRFRLTTEGLGGAPTTTDLPTGLNGLFDNISGSENTAGTVDYRAVDIYNAHATLTLLDAKLWIENVPGGADVAVGVEGANAITTIPDENTPPVGITFSTPVDEATALELGDIAPGEYVRVWVRRTATNSAPLANDGVTFHVSGDTL